MPSPSVGTPPLGGGPGLPEYWLWELEEPTEADLAGLCPDLLAGPPDGDDAWLGDLSLDELDALADKWAAGEGRRPPADGVGAGFGRDLPVTGRRGSRLAGRWTAWPLGGCWPGSPGCPTTSWSGCCARPGGLLETLNELITVTEAATRTRRRKANP